MIYTVLPTTIPSTMLAKMVTFWGKDVLTHAVTHTHTHTCHTHTHNTHDGIFNNHSKNERKKETMDFLLRSIFFLKIYLLMDWKHRHCTFEIFWLKRSHFVTQIFDWKRSNFMIDLNKIEIAVILWLNSGKLATTDAKCHLNSESNDSGHFMTNIHQSMWVLEKLGSPVYVSQGKFVLLSLRNLGGISTEVRPRASLLCCLKCAPSCTPEAFRTKLVHIKDCMTLNPSPAE